MSATKGAKLWLYSTLPPCTRKSSAKNHQGLNLAHNCPIKTHFNEFRRPSWFLQNAIFFHFFGNQAFEHKKHTWDELGWMICFNRPHWGNAFTRSYRICLRGRTLLSENIEIIALCGPSEKIYKNTADFTLYFHVDFIKRWSIIH